MLVSKYLKDFVISGGIDPYADVIDVGRKTAKKQERGKGQDTNQSQSAIVTNPIAHQFS
mgnify:CR=1 FL=1